VGKLHQSQWLALVRWSERQMADALAGALKDVTEGVTDATIDSGREASLQ